MKIKKKQIENLLSKFTEIYLKQQEMSDCLHRKKTFALAGRLMGDIGECLAGYLYDIDIEEIQTPGQDGLLDGKPAEIKVRTKDEKNKINHVHISDATISKNGCYLFMLVFDFQERLIDVKISNWISRTNLKKIPRTDKGFVTLSNLKKCLNFDDSVNTKKKKYISDWTIIYREVQ